MNTAAGPGNLCSEAWWASCWSGTASLKTTVSVVGGPLKFCPAVGVVATTSGGSLSDVTSRLSTYSPVRNPWPLCDTLGSKAGGAIGSGLRLGTLGELETASQYSPAGNPMNMAASEKSGTNPLLVAVSFKVLSF